MKSSTRTVLKSISFSLGFNAVSWLSFGFLYANYSTHNYAICAPMIAGVLAIPLYFILKMNCDDFYSSVFFVFQLLNFIMFQLIFSAIGPLSDVLIPWDRGQFSFAGLRYVAALITIAIGGFVPLLIDSIIYIIKKITHLRKKGGSYEINH